MIELPSPRIEGSFDLGQRRIGFAEYGRANGKTIFWFHGTPGARRQIPPATRLAVIDRRVRLVVLERPGIGASTPHAYDSVLGWAADVRAIADCLELREFGVIALSGGGPYALACAHEMPDRVVAAGIIGGVCPTFGPDATEGGLVNAFRPLGPVADYVHLPLGIGLSGLVHVVKRTPGIKDHWLDLYSTVIAPEADKRVFRRPEMAEMFMDDLVRGSRRSVLSLTFDVRLFLRGWGFLVRDISVPVRWWHGDADNFVPLSNAEVTVERIPDASLVVHHGASHLGGLDLADDVIDTILDLWP